MLCRVLGDIILTILPIMIWSGSHPIMIFTTRAPFFWILLTLLNNGLHSLIQNIIFHYLCSGSEPIGQIKKEAFYKDGQRNGKWIEYYENGQIKSEEFYYSPDSSVCYMVDNWIYYNEDGTVKEVKEKR